ncbi:MAG: sulfurtransferase-like selenium metabolism protein YedF [Candidatus Tenebribacter burtonii]|jgi:selenium metabolism protein YedF|nr:sulfurtransferase-like selenium metabolism protein YedF [Candidatus Tenebribacter burtonii]
MIFLYLNSDKMGEGEPELGKKLMVTFLRELAKSDIMINVIGCVNSGINLTTEGSEAITSLRELEQKGARIATCGTCLDFYNKRENLLVGEIGSMDQTVLIMSKADRIIKPN